MSAASWRLALSGSFQIADVVMLAADLPRSTRGVQSSYGPAPQVEVLPMLCEPDEPYTASVVTGAGSENRSSVGHVWTACAVVKIASPASVTNARKSSGSVLKLKAIVSPSVPWNTHDAAAPSSRSRLHVPAQAREDRSLVAATTSGSVLRSEHRFLIACSCPDRKNSQYTVCKDDEQDCHQSCMRQRRNELNRG